MRIPTPQLAGIVVLASIWGASFMFIKVMLDELGPVAIAWLRLGGGALLILAVVAAQRTHVPRNARYWRDVTTVALVAAAMPLVLIPWGERSISSQLAGLLNGTTPLWVAALANAALPAERLDRRATFGLALGFAGVLAVIGPDVLDLGDSSTQGALAVVLATLGYGAGAVFVRWRLAGEDSTLIAGSQSAIAFVLLTPLLLAGEGMPRVGTLSGRVLLASAALAFLASGVAYIIYYWLLANLHATQASLVTYLIPLAALFWGWLALDESIGVGAVPGLVLIAAGVYLVSAPRARPAERENAPEEPGRSRAVG